MYLRLCLRLGLFVSYLCELFFIFIFIKINHKISLKKDTCFLGHFCQTFSLKVLLSASLIFCQFQPGFGYKSVSYKKARNFRFSGSKSQSQQKLAKKMTQFFNTVSLKKPHSFYEPTHSTLQKIYCCNTAKNMFPVSVGKNICTAPFLDAQELHSWQMSVYSCKAPFESVCSRDVGSFYLLGG